MRTPQRQPRKGKGRGGGQFLPKPPPPISEASLEEQANPFVPLVEGPEEAARELVATLSDAASRMGVKFVWDETLDCRAKAFPAERLVRVHPELETDPVRFAEAIAHEMSHCADPWMAYGLTNRRGDLTEEDRADAEIVAQASAYLLARQHGFDNLDYSETYIHSWNDGSTAVPPRLQGRIKATFKALSGAP